MSWIIDTVLPQGSFWRVGYDAAFDDPVCLLVAVGAAGAHSGLWAVFQRFGPFKRNPGLAAHQLVCFPLFIVLGTLGWFGLMKALPRLPMTLEDRLLGADYWGDICARVMLGVQAWDFGAHLVTPGLRSPLMIMHHFATAWIASISAYNKMQQPYAWFYFGVVEISSVPLSFVNLFKPDGSAFPELTEKSAFIKSLNINCRIMFGFLFIIIRLIVWTVVVGMNVLDNWARLSDSSSKFDAVPRALSWLFIVMDISFSVLQLYWGTLVFIGLAKMLRPAAEEQEQKKKQ